MTHLPMRRALFAVLAAALFPLGIAAAASSPVRTCQETMARAGAGIVAKVIRLEQACLRKVARGRLPAGTRCVGIGGDVSTVTPGVLRVALQRVIDGAAMVVREKCATVDLLAAPPNGLGLAASCPAIHESCAGRVTDFDAAIACQACNHVSAAQYVLTVQYPGANATPDPNATATPTPIPTATASGPGGLSGTIVSFEVDATSRLSGFKFHVGYPGAKGSFRGTNEFVECITDTFLSFFISNHQANQDNLITLMGTAGVLGLPSTIACSFDVAAGQSISADDFEIIVDEVVTDQGGTGDPNDLLVATSLADSTVPCLGGTAVVGILMGSSFTDLAMTVRYPPALASIPGSGAVDPRVGVGIVGGASSAEDVDTGDDGVDDAVTIAVTTNVTTDGVSAEIHFDCIAPLSVGDLASFGCEVDSIANGNLAVPGATCTVGRIGFY